jgi:hypothetical protein
MNPHSGQPKPRPWLPRPLLAGLAVLIAVSFAGCISIPRDYYPTSDKLMRDATQSSNYLRKIGVTRVINSTFMVNQKLEQTFQLILIETLSGSCGKTLLVTPNDSGHPEFLDQQPRLASGVIDSFALAAAGREEGYSAIVAADIAALKTRKQRTGFWRFRKTHHYLQVLVLLDVYDPATGAKLISEPALREFEIDAADAQIIEAGKEIVIPEVSQKLEEIAEQMGDLICSVVNAQPWKGFIVADVAGGVLISSGSQQGLGPGSQFEVFDASKILQGAEGEKYIVPGFKIGEIQISHLGQQKSEAKILTQGPLPAGSILRPKP